MNWAELREVASKSPFTARMFGYRNWRGPQPSRTQICPVCLTEFQTGITTTLKTRCDDCKMIAKYLRRRAQLEVARAIRHGKLARPHDFACADCGRPAWQYDHRDYFQPLKVEPVCGGCNVRRGPGYPFAGGIDIRTVEAA